MTYNNKLIELECSSNYCSETNMLNYSFFKSAQAEKIIYCRFCNKKNIVSELNPHICDHKSKKSKKKNVISKRVNDENLNVKKRQQFKKERPLKKPSSELIQKLKQSVYLTKQQTNDDYIKTNAPLVINTDHFTKRKNSDLRTWSIEQVCEFIKSIPGCQDFESSFKDQF
ncbi:hypothetical protein BpHYR1_044536 [Brachionus plicatilis]|uniref:Uncharacterized protein n=1 Tax=Brachionus plicatilis TaxID=10195 RepID=A0A3M7P6W5_BRAPC|nr:hypothetical protein BpHYR1_044536 [Brachionus plicatilis]